MEAAGGAFSAPDSVTLPPLADLRLVPGVECAIVAHTSGIWACDVSAKGDLIASGARDASLALWDAQTGVLKNTNLLPVARSA
jgi:WD40 repeat protein